MIGELERLSGDDRGFLRGFLGVEGLKPWYGSQELEGEQPLVDRKAIRRVERRAIPA